MSEEGGGGGTDGSVPWGRMELRGKTQNRNVEPILRFKQWISSWPYAFVVIKRVIKEMRKIDLVSGLPVIFNERIRDFRLRIFCLRKRQGKKNQSERDVRDTQGREYQERPGATP